MSALILTEVIAASGVPWALVLREKDLPLTQRQALAESICPAGAGGDLQIVVAVDHANEAQRFPDLPVHLSSAALAAARPHAPGWGASCHTAADVDAAAAAGASYVFVSPCFDSISKAGYTAASDALGLLGNHRHTVALGGLHPGNVHAAWQHGAYGVALLGALWRSERPATVARDVVATYIRSRDETG